MSGPNATRQPIERLVEHRHLDDHPAHPLGREAATSSAVLAPSDVPTTTASSTARWSSSATTCSANSVVE